jgi:hypothetical protein
MDSLNTLDLISEFLYPFPLNEVALPSLARSPECTPIQAFDRLIALEISSNNRSVY